MTETPLFKKLNFKQQQEILILNSPTAFEAELKAMQDCTTIKTDLNSVGDIEFVLTFIKTQAEIDAIAPLIDQKLKGDGIVWFAYPKGTSKKYKAEINRDKGWSILGKLDFEPVRQVAIDDDWSALRFRKVAFIKTMSRSADFAMTAEGRAKTTKGKIHTTDYFDTFIEVSEDTKATRGTKPPAKDQKTVAEMQYELLANNPYKFTSDDILFQVYVDRNDLTEAEYAAARRQFFSKGQPCFRTSPLTKTYGFGVHADSSGKIAIYGMETEQYEQFQKDPDLKKVKAMRTSRK